MNNKAILILAVLLTSALAFGDDVPYAEGRLLVRFATSGYGLDSPAAQQRAQARQQILNQTGGGLVVHVYERLGGWCLVELPQGACVETALEPYASTAGIVAVEPDYKIKLCRIPNDPQFNYLWAMRNTGQSGGTPGADIDAHSAWDYETGSADIIVAVTDTGVDYTHPDLQANMWINEAEQDGLPGVDDDENGYIDDIYGYDFGEVDSDPMDLHGHGTHVAGTIGAVGNNNQGVTGVCWDVNLMALKIMLDDGGLNPETYSSVAAEAIEYAVDNGARVINASWRIYEGWAAQPELIEDAVDYARNAGVLFVAAAGNETIDNDDFPAWPASYDLENIISVMATGHSDLKADYSNYGATSVDIAAPGGDFSRGGEPGEILSTIPGADYGYMQGTSMAAPHVAGACALILSVQPSLTYSQVKTLLMDTVDELPQLAGQCVSGGRLNLLNAIERLVLDEEAPEPDPAEWESWSRPKATGMHSIAMQAKKATDNKGSVQYLFKCTTNDSFSSGWQDEAFYKAEGLAAATTYTFRLRVRDDSNNMTGWSVSASAKTALGPSDPCSPFPDPAQWFIKPRRLSTTGTAVIMVAMTASDESEPVEYEFRAYIDVGGIPVRDTMFDRPFDSDPTYYLPNGLLALNNKYYFEVRARDAAGNTTAWSSLEAVSLTTPQTIEVPFDQPTIQDAIDVAHSGDTIIIHPGTYPGKEFDVHNDIVIRSTNPDNPDIVASTIIDCQGFRESARGFWINTGHCEIKGLTITNVAWRRGDARDGYELGHDGYHGYSDYGGAIYIHWGNHLIENCVISDCIILAGDAGDGADGNDLQFPYYSRKGGDGGDGGDVGGVGIYLDWGSHAVIRSTTIDGCYAFPGRGGNGGEGASANEQADPNNPGGRGGNGGNAGAVYGAGVFVDHGASALLEDCTITNCYAIGESGGDGGMGGTNADSRITIDPNNFDPNVVDINLFDPNIYELTGTGDGGHGGVPGPVLGGGIYCAGNTVLRGCTIQRNFALGGYGGDGGDAGEANPVRGSFDGGVGGLLDEHYTSPQYPQGPFGPDEYTAKGGGVCVADGASVTIEDCSIEDNVTRGSVAGLGGRWSVRTWLPVRPRYNYQIESLGAGVFYDVGTVADIHDSEILRNRAIDYPLDVDIFQDFEDNEDPFPEGPHPHPERFLYTPIDYFCVGGGLYFDTAWYVEITGSIIADNNVPAGGGMAVTSVTNDFHLDNCQISNNRAKYGGGAAWANSIVDANNCIISGNIATASTGGGVHCGNSSLSLRNSEVVDNSSLVSGGGIYIIGVDSTSGSQEIINCLIKNNQAGLDGGGIAARDDSLVSVKNCTIVDNSTVSVAKGSGGGLSCITVNSAASSFVEITSSVLWDNESTFGPQIAVGDPTVQDNPMATVWTRYSDVEGGKNAVFEGSSSDPWLGPWSYWGIGNISTDPLFAQTDADDPLSAYYLSHIAAGQQADSPCIDAGEYPADDLANDVGMAVTTRTDGVPDSCDVDMGYHYQATTVSDTYILIIEVLADAGFDPNGSLVAELGDPNFRDDHNFRIEAREDLNSIYVTQGAVVKLAAVPDTDFKVRQWRGTDHDSSTALTNTVIMDSHKVVSVSFAPDGYYYLVTDVNTDNGRIDYRDERLDEPIPHPGRTLHLPGEVVELFAIPDNPSHVTHWFGSDNDLTIARQNEVTMNSHRNVTVSFTAPRILYVPGEYTNIQTAIDDAEDGDIVQIAPGEYTSDNTRYELIGKQITLTSSDPEDPDVVANTILRKGIQILDVERTCVIDGLTFDNLHIFAWPGFDGGTEENPLADGSNGDPMAGGALLLHVGFWDLQNPPEGSSPDVRNCVFSNRSIHAGDGGKGAIVDDLPGDGGWGGWAHGGAVSLGADSNPRFTNCKFIDCFAVGGDGGNGTEEPDGRGGLWDLTILGAWGWSYGPYVEFFKYSGLGGAVYIDANSSPEFIDCEFINCQAYGGVSGEGGRWVDPDAHWRINRFGGAVYCADESSPTFTRCSFVDNVADTNGPELWDWESWHSADQAPAFSDDIFLSYGGAVAFEDGATAVFIDCNFVGNQATVGGGAYWSWADPCFVESSFVDNNAFHGGGLLCVGGHGIIERCVFTGNQATINGAQGGAIASLGANTEIIDTQVIGNFSQTSGGGIYISNKDVDGNELASWNMVLLHNCLIAENEAGSSGGGISANWHGFPEIENCTIANNLTVSGGYGGGLYSSYGNYATINNSIIWGNVAGAGNQIALRPTERPSDVVISYSDIQGGLIAVQPPAIGGNIWADIGCDVVNAGGNIGTSPTAHNPRFVTGPLGGNYYLSQIAAGQTEDSPCVDAGDKTASTVKLASDLTMDNYTTRTDWTQKSDAFDKGKVDMGFHYYFKHLIDECRVCDLEFDGVIGSDDLYEFSLRWGWLGEHCSEQNNYCDGGDLNFDHKVDFGDFALLAGCWLTADDEPPMPNPMEWEVRPYSSSSTAPYAIRMVAVEAFDSWGWLTPQYQFECTSDPNWSGDWQDERVYEPVGLEPDMGYVFRVRARDGMNNVTRWSVKASAVTGEEQYVDDTTAPVPNPMTWLREPYCESITEVGMVASTATDESGVEYGFWNKTLDPGGTQIVWQDEPSFVDTDLVEDVNYTYVIAARDKSFNRNQTEWSVERIGSPCDRDTEPPVTGVHADIYKAAFADPEGDAISNPSEVYVATPQADKGYYHVMTAVEATDATEPVWYKFICTNNGAFSSGWQQDPTYAVRVSVLQSKDYYMWQVITRDSVTPVPNQGHLSDYHNCKGDVVPYP
jgi:subtilisin family serine protease